MLTSSPQPSINSSLSQINPSDSILLHIDKTNRKAKMLLHKNLARDLASKHRILSANRSTRRTNQSAADKTILDLDTTDMNICQLRQEKSQQQVKQELLKARMRFYQTEKQRYIKTAEQAKRRYTTIIHTRQQALKLKNNLAKNRQTIQKQHQHYIQSVREKASIEREQKSRTLQMFKSRKISEASILKEKKLIDHNKITVDRKLTLQSKKEKAKMIRSQQLNLQKIKGQLQESKQNLAKINHSTKIINELNKKKSFIRQNRSLMKKLLDKEQQIRDVAISSQKQIQQYEHLFKFKIFKQTNKTQLDFSQNKNNIFVTRY